MTTPLQDASALVELVRKRSPDVVRLAQSVCLASRIEPELLRQARLMLLPDADAGVEADLWFSPLVQSATPVALVLLPEVVDLLRRELSKSSESLRRSWELLEEVHRTAPVAIRLEEKITWQALSGGPMAEDSIEKDLLSVVSAIVTQQRKGLARWALRALPRLPENARRTKAATTLMLTATAHLGAWHMLDQQLEGAAVTEGSISQLSIALPPDLSLLPVGVRLLEAGGDLASPGATAAPRNVVEFSNPPTDDTPAGVITVPGTNPLLLEVSWGEGSKRQVKNLSLYQGRTETIEVDSDELRIRTARGDLYTLRRDFDKGGDPETEKRNSVLARIPRPPATGYVARYDTAGRDIVDRLRQELVSGRRVVAVLGTGGIGKTVVVAETVRELLGEFDPRIVWISAEGRSDFTRSIMLDEIAVQLGRSDMRTLPPKEKILEVRSLLSSAPALIVIDQFEVIGQKEQTSCLNFLKSARRPALVTTRQSLPGVFTLALDAMSQQEASDFLERLISMADNPQAFGRLDRNRLFKVSKNNPLLIQWVVAQIHLSQDPEKVLDELSVGKGDVMARVFDRSFNLPELGDDARAALLALSLFVPSASLDALANVAGFGDDQERMAEAATRLRSLSLLNVTDWGDRLSVEGIIRQMLKARMAKDKSGEVIRLRFIAYFLAFAQSHNRSTAEDYDALEGEFENLLDAMDMAVELRNWDSVIDFCLAITEFLEVRGYWDEALHRYDLAVRATKMAKRPELLPQLGELEARILLRRREFAKAQSSYEFVRDNYRKAGNREGLASALRNLGTIALERKRPAEAQRLYQESLKIARELKDQAGIANNLHNLAIVAQVRGKLNEALQLYQQSLSIAQELGDERSSAISLHQIAVISIEMGNYAEARSLLEESLRIKRKLGDQDGIAGSLHQLGILMREVGERELAEQSLREALGIYEQLGSPSAAEVIEDLNLLEGKAQSSRSRKTSSKKSASKKKAATTPSGKKKGGSSKASAGRGGSKRDTPKGSVPGYKAGRRPRGGYGRGSSRSYR